MYPRGSDLLVKEMAADVAEAQCPRCSIAKVVKARLGLTRVVSSIWPVADTQAKEPRENAGSTGILANRKERV